MRLSSALELQSVQDLCVRPPERSIKCWTSLCYAGRTTLCFDSSTHTLHCLTPAALHETLGELVLRVGHIPVY